MSRRGGGADPLGSLTASEREVAKFIAEGLTNGEIADRLFLAPGTVKNYVSAVMRNFECSDRTALALKIDRFRSGRGSFFSEAPPCRDM